MAVLEVRDPAGGCHSSPGPAGKEQAENVEAQVSAFTQSPCFPVKLLQCFLPTGSKRPFLRAIKNVLGLYRGLDERELNYLQTLE